jgi:hypothetical protein
MSRCRGRSLLLAALMPATAWATCSCSSAPGGRPPASAAASYPFTPAACLAQSPVDLSIDVNEPPPSFYVNELRLGYARGEAIFLSRPLCDMYGEPLCRFVRAHELAHHYTKTVGQQSLCAETLADCWAAAHSDQEAVEAALLFFRSRRGAGGYHGLPSDRADTIARCLHGWERARAAARAPDATAVEGRLHSTQ